MSATSAFAGRDKAKIYANKGEFLEVHKRGRGDDSDSAESNDDDFQEHRQEVVVAPAFQKVLFALKRQKNLLLTFNADMIDSDDDQQGSEPDSEDMDANITRIGAMMRRANTAIVANRNEDAGSGLDNFNDASIVTESQNESMTGRPLLI